MLIVECWWWWSWGGFIIMCRGEGKAQKCHNIFSTNTLHYIFLPSQIFNTLFHLFLPQWEIYSSRTNVCYDFILHVALGRIAHENKWSLLLFLVSHWCFLFTCLLNSPARTETKSHWLHLFDFSPMCVFKCVLKLPAWEDAKSHWLHLFDFSFLCVFKCVFKWHACEVA